MRTISNILAAVLLLAASAIAQEPPPEVGFIRFVNAVAAGEGNASVLIDGENLYPKGYRLGQKTGGLGLKAGSHTISVKKQGVETGNTKVTIAKGETLTLIGFAERKPPAKEGDPPVWETRILRLKQSDPGSGYHLTFVSVCDKDEIRVGTLFQGQSKPKEESVKRLSTTGMRLGSGRGEAQITVDGKVVTMVSTDDPGNYVVLLYQDATGEIKALSFFDPKFVIAG